MLNLAPVLGHFARLGDHNFVRGHGCHHPVCLSQDQRVGIPRHLGFHARCNERRLGDQQRHRLALHVRPHQGPVRIVMLEERNQTGRHGHQLLGRHVHVIDLVRQHVDEVRPEPAGHLLGCEVTAVVDGLVGLGNKIFLLKIAGQVVDLVGHPAPHHFPVGALDKAKVVHTGKRGQAGDQTNVGSFRGLHRTNAAIMGGMNIPDLEPGAFAGQTSRAKRRQAALMGQFRQRVDLIHKLRQLASAKKVAHNRRQGLGIDQLGRRHGVQLLIEERHPLLDQALGAGQANAALVGQELAHGADPATAQVIDIIDGAIPQLEAEQILGCLNQVLLHQRAGAVIPLKTEFLVHLITAHPTQVVSLGIEEQSLDQCARVGRSGRIARA